MRGLLLWLFVFSPAIVTGIGIHQNAVNVPTWDDWERGPLLQRYYDGTLDLRYLNGAHINHRILFPRLIIIGMNEMTGGDLRAEIFLSYGIFVLGGVALFLLVRRTFGPSPWIWLLGFLVNLLYFSPLQYQNFLWAIQIAMLIPIACLPICVLVMTLEWAWWKKLLVVIPVTVFATHSFGHGLLLWPVVFCLGLLLPSFGSWRQRTAFLAIFGASAAAVIVLYFNWHFETNTHHSYGTAIGDPPRKGTPISEIIEDPRRFMRFFHYSLGNSLARLFSTDPTRAAKNVSRTCLFLFGLGALGMLAGFRDKRQWQALLPWAALGAFSICAAAILSMGRSDLSAERALLPRYASSTMFLGIAITGMGAFFIRRWRNAAGDPSSEKVRSHVAVGLGVGACVLLYPGWQYGLHKMEAWKLARLEERAALLYLKHFEPEGKGLFDYGEHFDTFTIRWANYLNDKGLIDPPMFEKPDFGTFERDPMNDALEPQRADFLGVRMVDEVTLAFDGYATLRGPDRIADGVLLTWREKYKHKKSDHGWQVFAMAEMSGQLVPKAAFMDGAFGPNSNYSRRERYARWKEGASIADLPEGVILEVKAWAMDADKMRLTPFRGRLEIDRRKEGVPKVKQIGSLERNTK